MSHVTFTILKVLNYSFFSIERAFFFFQTSLSRYISFAFRFDVIMCDKRHDKNLRHIYNEIRLGYRGDARILLCTKSKIVVNVERLVPVERAMQFRICTRLHTFASLEWGRNRASLGGIIAIRRFIPIDIKQLWRRVH